MAAVDTLLARDQDVVFQSLEDVAREKIVTVEGNKIPDADTHLSMKCLIATPHVIVLRAERKAGLKDPQHKHDDHDTVSTLVSGHMTVHIDGKSFDAQPGSIWRHRPGAVHWSEAHTDSVVIEIKTPPVKTW